MRLQEYQLIAEAEEQYWWHKGRLSIVEQQLEKYISKSSNVVNIGCGTGGTVPLPESPLVSR